MATVSEILEVRELINEPDETTYSDIVIGDLIDQLSGIHNAAANLWRKKAAAYSEMVDTSEGGASRKLSDLLKNANAMAKVMQDQADVDSGASLTPAPRVTKIVRST